MTQREREAIIAISLMGAMADGIPVAFMGSPISWCSHLDGFGVAGLVPENAAGGYYQRS